MTCITIRREAAGMRAGTIDRYYWPQCGHAYQVPGEHGKEASMQLTITEKRLIGRYLRTDYSGVRNLRFGADHAVRMTVDKCPGTGRPGRMFAGWDTDLLRDAKRRL